MDRRPGAFKGKLALSWPEIATGVAVIVLGLVLVIAPNLARSVLFNVVGIGCILIGAVHVIRYCRLDARAAVVSNDMATGLLFIAGGILLIVFEKPLESLLSIMVGLVILAGGVIQIQSSLGFRHMKVSRWYVELICAAISVALGILVIANPFTAMNLTMRVIGVSLIVEGVMDVVSRAAFKRACNNFIDAVLND